MLLRGVGLGNWLLPEGYMFRFLPPGPQSPREIEALIADLVGHEDAATFWRSFREHWINEPDIAAIAAAQMNHVRLPINARLVMSSDGRLLDDGIALIDQLIEWCRAHGVWVILDLHGAPGGQTGTNIDDSNGAPELFGNGRYRALTIALWRMLAERYCDDATVAGYDLLNEPLPEPHGREHAASLVRLYQDLTAAIRGVDANHLIIYEGTHWATNWDIFTERWDDNSALSFHKYWSRPDRSSIEPFLERREALALPIYMGEGGENGLGWLQTAFQLYEDCDISWNFWPWKKVDTYSSPCSVVPPAGWDAVLAYARGGARPTRDAALETLTALADAMRFENCARRPEVVAALRRTAPVRLAAAAFGFRGPGRSYHTSAASPLADFRQDDDVTVRPADGTATATSFDYTDGPDRHERRWEVVLQPGEWLAYEFGLVEDTVPTVTVFGERPGRGGLAIAIGESYLVCESMPGGWQAALRKPIPAGRHLLRVICTDGSVCFTAVAIEVAQSPLESRGGADDDRSRLMAEARSATAIRPA